VPKLRSTKTVRIAGIIAITLLIVGGWAYWITRPGYMVETFTIITSEPEDVSLIERYVAQHLDTPAWFGLSSRRHRTLLKTDRLTEDILRLFPIFKEGSAAVFDNNLLIELEQRQPSALWCQTTQTKEQCWFIDETKVMFRKAPVFSEGVYVKYTSQEHETPSIGEPILTEPLRQYTSDVLRVVSETELEPTRVTVETSDRVAIHIQEIFGYKVPQSGRFIVSTNQDLTTIEERIMLLLATPEFEAEITEYSDKFDYADLRFPGRLVYKLNDE